MVGRHVHDQRQVSGQHRDVRGRAERDIIAERTTEALAEAREAGVRIGRPPAVPDHTVTRVRDLRASGMALRAVADQLTADRVPTGHGAPTWRVSAVRRVLHRSGGDCADLAVRRGRGGHG